MCYLIVYGRNTFLEQYLLNIKMDYSKVRLVQHLIVFVLEWQSYSHAFT